MSNYEARFGGVGRLFSADGLERLRSAHVCVIGIGGVGSWAVEALARSGVGALTLVDLDDICVTNVNRQLHAVEGEIGRAKIDAMARRVTAINPECAVQPTHAFFTETSAPEILRPRFDYVVDAIDSPSRKSLLIASCRERGTPVFVVGGAGGRTDPAALKVADLAFSTHDRLLTAVRSQLRSDYGFPRGEKKRFGVDCVYSTEPVVYPRTDGTVCEQPEPGSNLRLDCESGYGTACFVTGTFGFIAAGHVVREIASGKVPAKATHSPVA